MKLQEYSCSSCTQPKPVKLLELAGLRQEIKCICGSQSTVRIDCQQSFLYPQESWVLTTHARKMNLGAFLKHCLKRCEILTLHCTEAHKRTTQTQTSCHYLHVDMESKTFDCDRLELHQDPAVFLSLLKCRFALKNVSTSVFAFAYLATKRSLPV